MTSETKTRQPQRVVVQFDPAIHQAAMKQSHREETSMASLVRRAVAQYLDQHAPAEVNDAVRRLIVEAREHGAEGA